MHFIKREKLYSIVIIIIYIVLCLFIYKDNKTIDKVTTENKDITTNKNIYGRIVIEKIDIDRYLYPINDIKNNVEENITILDGSIFPTEDKSILFLAAHSGDGDIAYFDNLDKLDIGDIVKIYYQNKWYYYKMIDSWEEEKNGYIHVNKKEENQLILTTCSKRDKNRQLVVEFIQKND